MQKNTVTVDRSQTPFSIEFAPSFNTAVAFIDRHLDEGRREKVAIRTEDEDVTYGQLAERVNRCGNVFKSLGLSSGDRMLMAVTDGPEFYYSFWGAIKLGIIPIPVNTLLRAPDYQFLIDDSGCAAVTYSEALESEIAPAVTKAKNSALIALPTRGDSSLWSRMVEAGDQLDPAERTPTDECFWLYSSGSTGNPKGVVHSHRDMVITSQRYAVDTLGVKESDTFFSAGKLFFSYGFGNAMTFPLWIGGTAILSPRRTAPDMAFELIEQFKPSVFFGVPTLYGQQLRLMDSQMPDLSSLRICASAGEALPAPILERWKELTDLTIIDGLGSTEVLHIFVCNRHEDYRPGTSGKVVAGYDVKIVGDDGEPVEYGEIGTLHVKGLSNAKHYWNNPEKTASTMLGEWINTGDMYYQNEDGYFVNGGRSDDMLKVGGMWCSPFEIESRLIAHNNVAEAAVVGRADEDGMIKPEAFIVLKESAKSEDDMADELREHCKAGLERFKYPRWFNFVDQLPKTTTGKIQRFKLRS